ncbi:MAG: tetratricopeptide repeat protein, partial [Calditrichaeota bacterium]|nr:tetratricopeptide repeat protein [Calditrichota bacterium]
MKTILILLLLVAVLYASGQDDPGFKSYMKAYENVLNGNWDESISQFESLIKQHPKSEYVDDAFFWIAYSKKEQNENEESMQLFLDFVKKYPKSNHVENANRNIRTLARTLSKAGKTKYSLYYNYGLNGNSVTVSSTFPMAELAAAQSIESSELAEKMTVLSQQVAEIAPVGDVAGVTWSLGDDDD